MNGTLTRREVIALAAAAPAALLGGSTLARARGTDSNGFGRIDQTRILFTRLAPTALSIYIADADGSHERRLLHGDALDYNASFSADGNWIVFTSERAGSADLYRVHPDGTGLERLTNDPSFDDQGALSPDNRTVAFVSTRKWGTANVWLLDLETRKARPVTHTTDAGNFRPSWSPDGSWIAFTSDRDAPHRRWNGSWELIQSASIYIIRPNGKDLRRITPAGPYAGSPKWSPDGQRVVFYEATNATSSSTNIVSIDVRTNGRVVLAQLPARCLSPQYLSNTEVGYLIASGPYKRVEGLAYTSSRPKLARDIKNPSWSPDGKSIVYNTSALTGISRFRPTFSRDARYDLWMTGYLPAVSPDKKHIVMSGYPNSALTIMDADGGNARILFNAAAGNVVASPSWSPDGKTIAFGIGGYFRRPLQPAQIALINSDGSNLRLISDEDLISGFPSFSPDGKRLVYKVSGKEQGLRIRSLDDGKVTALTHKYDTFPSWSPTGDHITFTSFRDGDYEIYDIHPDGSGLRKLTNDHGDDAHSAWSPDGQWLIFTSSRMGWKDEAMLPDQSSQSYGEVFVMRADGTDVRQLTDNQWEDGGAVWWPR